MCTAREVLQKITYFPNYGRETKEETGNLHLQEGALPKFSLYCLLLRRWASQGQGTLQMSNGAKQQSNTKENLLQLLAKRQTTCIGSWAAMLPVSWY